MNCCREAVKFAFAGLAVMAATSVLAAGSLADAKAQIAPALKDANKMVSVVKGLSPADQKAFVAEVNSAIANLPGNPSEKAQMYITANQAILKGADAKQMAAMVAEVFATVPVEALPAVTDNFAKSLFDRKSSKVSDAQYEAVADNVMKAVADRTANVSDGAVRSACAAVMLVKASNGSPAGLDAKLAEKLPSSSRDVAKKDWIPAAVKGNYDPMFATTESAEVLDRDSAAASDLVIRAPSPDVLGAIAADLSSGIPVLSVLDNPQQNAEPMIGLSNDVFVEPMGYAGQD